MKKAVYTFASIIFSVISCSRETSETFSTGDNYRYIEGEVEVVFTPVQTKSEDENTQTFVMEADDEISGIHLTSIVSSTSIGSTYTRLEQYTSEGIFVGSLLIHDDKIVQVQFNADIDDAALGAPVTKGIFTKCVGQKYKTISDIIDSDGESKLLCDGLNIFQLCNAAKLVASAIICIRNGK